MSENIYSRNTTAAWVKHLPQLKEHPSIRCKEGVVFQILEHNQGEGQSTSTLVAELFLIVPKEARWATSRQQSKPHWSVCGLLRLDQANSHGRLFVHNWRRPQLLYTFRYQQHQDVGSWHRFSFLLAVGQLSAPTGECKHWRGLSKRSKLERGTAVL